jgi:hypothetical protein
VLRIPVLARKNRLQSKSTCFKLTNFLFNFIKQNILYLFLWILFAKKVQKQRGIQGKAATFAHRVKNTQSTRPTRRFSI